MIALKARSSTLAHFRHFKLQTFGLQLIGDSCTDKNTSSNLRIRAYGVVDEINATIGIILSSKIDDDITIILTKIQNDLFVVGSDLPNA